MSNKISKSNYEEFMIDFLDGTLSTEREAELLLFLDANPELKAELDGLDKMILDIDTPVFEFRDGLKKSILDSGTVNTDNFEEFCVAFYEGDLLDKEEKYLKNFVHDHPSLLNDFHLYAKLKLSENNYIHFPYKTNLQQFAINTTEAINKSNYLDFLIAQNEGDLTSARAKELHQFLAVYPQYKNDAIQITNLKLKADIDVVFDNKSMLKRRAVLIAITNKWMNVAAASVAIVVVFYSIIPRQLESGDLLIIKAFPVIHQTNLSNQDNSSSEIIEQNISLESIVEQSSIPSQSSTKIKKHPKQSVSQQATRQIVKVASVSTLACNGLKIDSELQVKDPINNADIIQTVNTGKAKNSTNDGPSEKTIELYGYVGKAASRMGHLLSKTDRLKKDRIKGQLRNIADIAVVGFNKMTEGDLRLPSKNTAPEENEVAE